MINSKHIGANSKQSVVHYYVQSKRRDDYRMPEKEYYASSIIKEEQGLYKFLDIIRAQEFIRSLKKANPLHNSDYSIVKHITKQIPNPPLKKNRIIYFWLVVIHLIVFVGIAQVLTREFLTGGWANVALVASGYFGIMSFEYFYKRAIGSNQ